MYPLITPLAEVSGGDTQETRMVWAVRVVQVALSGGCSGTPSAVLALNSSDVGPAPTLLKACTTTEYWVYVFRLETWKFSCSNIGCYTQAGIKCLMGLEN